MNSDIKTEIESLKKSEARYRILLDTMSHGVQVNDCEGTITYSNRAHHMILGYEYGELLGKKIWDVISSRDERETLKNYFAFLVNEQPLLEPYFARNKRKDGASVYLKIEWDYERKDGILIGFISIITDISGYIQAELALNEKENILRSIFDIRQEKDNFTRTVFDAIQDGISVLDKNFNVLLVNKIMREWYAHMLPFEGNMKCYEVYHGRSIPCEVCPYIRTLKSKKLEREEVPFVKAKGVVGTLELFTYPIIDKSGEILGVVEHVSDITINPVA